VRKRCEELDIYLTKLVREETFGSLNIEQLGVLTLLADSLQTAARELTTRAESILLTTVRPACAWHLS